MKFGILVSLSIAAVVLATCAPSIQRDSPERILSSDSEAERNAEAFETLSQRNSESASQASSQSSSNEGQAFDHTDVPPLPVTVLEPPRTAAELGEGRIARADLLVFLENGPHGILSAFEVDPVMEEDAFRGYRIASFDPRRDVATGSGLRVGDVVSTVNGFDISRPEGFMQAWDALADADHLSVDIVRRGDPQTLSWTIE